MPEQWAWRVRDDREDAYPRDWLAVTDSYHPFHDHDEDDHHTVTIVTWEVPDHD